MFRCCRTRSSRSHSSSASPGCGRRRSATPTRGTSAYQRILEIEPTHELRIFEARGAASRGDALGGPHRDVPRPRRGQRGRRSCASSCSARSRTSTRSSSRITSRRTRPSSWRGPRTSPTARPAASSSASRRDQRCGTTSDLRERVAAGGRGRAETTRSPSACTARSGTARSSVTPSTRSRTTSRSCSSTRPTSQSMQQLSDLYRHDPAVAAARADPRASWST